MSNLDSILKSRDITLPTKVHLVKAMVFPVVMYGRESWTVKKAECQRIALINHASMCPEPHVCHTQPPSGPYLQPLIRIRCGLWGTLMPFRRLPRFLTSNAVIRLSWLMTVGRFWSPGSLHPWSLPHRAWLSPSKNWGGLRAFLAVLGTEMNHNE